MQITQDMIDDLNSNVLLAMGSGVKIKNNRDDTWKLAPINENMIDSYIINPTNEFYDILENFFISHGIEIKWNNTGSVFWSRIHY